jgi:hypothetical protein
VDKIEGILYNIPETQGNDQGLLAIEEEIKRQNEFQANTNTNQNTNKEEKITINSDPTTKK